MLSHLETVDSSRLKRSLDRYSSKTLLGGLRRHAKGQTLLIFVLALPAMVGATALGADVAVEYYTWVKLQKAADAAALAGATYLPDNPTQAIATAQSLAEANGVTASEITTNSTTNNNNDMNVQIQRTVPYSFAKVLGLTNALVTAGAIATPTYLSNTVNAPTPSSASGGDSNGSNGSYGSSTGASALIPIGLNSTTSYSDGESMTLQQGQTAPGNWDLLALGGTGGANLRTNLANGYAGMVTVGDWVTTEPGKKVGPVDQGLGDRLTAAQTAYPNGTYSSHSLNDPRVLVLPIVNWSGQGRTSVQVTGFATVWLNSVSGGAASVNFINQVVANTYGTTTANTSGARGAPILIQ